MSLRRLLVYIGQLPQDSRVKRALSKAPETSFADTVALQTRMLNEFRGFLYAWQKSHAPKASVPKPEMIRMPDSVRLSQPVERALQAAIKRSTEERQKKREFANMADIHRFIQNLNKA